MLEARAATAIAMKDLRQLARYPLNLASLVFMPLYQGLIPSILFGTAFLVGGRALGLEAAVGSADLAGFLFLGAVVSGVTASTFWGVAFGLRFELDSGTLEAVWLTPTRRDTLVLGRALSVGVVFLLTQAVLLVIGVVVFGAHFLPTALLALPALGLAAVSMIGVAYLLAAAVLLMKEANFFIDTTNFLTNVLSGTGFPITVLPGFLQAVALVLPTTYALDVLRHYAIGSRPLMDPLAEHAILVALALVSFPIGRFFFERADRRLRRTGGLAQY